MGGGPPNVVKMWSKCVVNETWCKKKSGLRRFFDGSCSCPHSPHNSHSVKHKKTETDREWVTIASNRKRWKKLDSPFNLGPFLSHVARCVHFLSAWCTFLLNKRRIENQCFSRGHEVNKFEGGGFETMFSTPPGEDKRRGSEKTYIPHACWPQRGRRILPLMAINSR